MKNKINPIGMTIAQLDDAIVRKHGTDARVGNYRFLVARGSRRDYQSEIISAHRASRAAEQACGEDCVVWGWNSYMNPNGGYHAY